MSGVRYGVNAARRMHGQPDLHHGVNGVVTGGGWGHVHAGRVGWVVDRGEWGGNRREQNGMSECFGWC